MRARRYIEIIQIAKSDCIFNLCKDYDDLGDGSEILGNEIS